MPELQGPVTIDGELNEPVWARAAVIQPFCRTDGSGPEREHTALRLWHDAEALYLGWTCQDADIQATLTNHDDHLFEEEVVEFFVAPNELSCYYEFEWNPRGATFDALIKNRLDSRGHSKAINGDLSYTAGEMKSAVKVKGTLNDSMDKDEFWQVEIKLPFADLGQPAPKPKEVWRANFYRVNRGKGLPVEFLSWSPTMSSSFHRPNRFGYLEFGQ